MRHDTNPPTLPKLKVPDINPCNRFSTGQLFSSISQSTEAPHKKHHLLPTSLSLTLPSLPPSFPPVIVSSKENKIK